MAGSRITIRRWAIGLECKDHAFLDLGWMLKRNHTRDDRPLVQSKAKTVTELQTEG